VAEASAALWIVLQLEGVPIGSTDRFRRGVTETAG
jgi:hypothetical protein